MQCRSSVRAQSLWNIPRAIHERYWLTRKVFKKVLTYMDLKGFLVTLFY